MDNNEFDQFIKKSMEHFKDDSSSNWSFMEQKMNASSDSELSSEMEDIYLDGVAFDNMNNLQEPYDAANWELMSARLDEEYAYRRKVVVTKMMEALVVLLLIWTATNFISTKKETSTPQPLVENNSIEILPQSIIADASKTNTNNSTTSTSTFNSSVEHNNTLTNSTLVDEDNSSLETNIDSEVVSSIATPTLLEEVEVSTNRNTEIGNVLPIQDISLTLNQPIDNAENLGLDENTFLNEAEPVESKKSNILKRTLSAIISPLKSRNFPELKFGNKPLDPDVSKMLSMRKEKTNILQVSMISALDHNYVSTELSDEDYRAQGFRVYDRGEFSYGGGIAVAFQMKKLSFGTGVIYNSIKYQQFSDTETTGDFENYTQTRKKGAEINLIQIPVHLQFQIYQRKRWNFYALSGASLNLAVQNNFDFQETALEPQAKSAPRSAGNAVAELAKERKGFLEGGKLGQNSYITTNLGFGVERYFSYRWSLFLQPVYRYNISSKGFGLDQKDVINTGSIQFGAKVRLR